MFELVISDFYSTKNLWNKGLNIMKKVKEQLKIDNIIFNYVEILMNIYYLTIINISSIYI
jgi:hypothetical protein